MKKLLVSGLVISGLIMASPTALLAGGHGGSKCYKSSQKESSCKSSKLKKKLKTLWANKDALELKDKQLDKIADIKHTALKDLIQLKADKEIVAVDIKTAFWADSIDLNKVNDLIDKKYAAKAKTAKVFAKALSDVQKVLTIKQNEQWKEIMLKAYLSKGRCSKCASAKFCPLTGKPMGK